MFERPLEGVYRVSEWFLVAGWMVSGGYTECVWRECKTCDVRINQANWVRYGQVKYCLITSFLVK